MDRMVHDKPADDVIEQLVANSANASECIVATDDNAERETVGALGATTLKAQDLAEWVKRADARQASIASSSFSPMRRNKTSSRPAALSKRQEVALRTNGIRSGKSSCPTIKMALWSPSMRT